VGGHKELIRDGETGVLFRAGSEQDLAHKVLDLLSKPERWPKMKAAGRLYVETERNWTKSVSNYDAIYSRLVK